MRSRFVVSFSFAMGMAVVCDRGTAPGVLLPAKGDLSSACHARCAPELASVF